VRFLLDTQCWLWMQAEPDRFSSETRKLLLDPGNELFLSAASSWEIAIKTALGKLERPAAADRFVPEQLAEDGIDSLAIEHSHALRIAGLALHHSDPFDRLLVAQAQLERCAFLTADAQILDYDVEVVWGGRQAPPRARSRRRS